MKERYGRLVAEHPLPQVNQSHSKDALEMTDKQAKTSRGPTAKYRMLGHYFDKWTECGCSPGNEAASSNKKALLRATKMIQEQ